MMIRFLRIKHRKRLWSFTIRRVEQEEIAAGAAIGRLGAAGRQLHFKVALGAKMNLHSAKSRVAAFAFAVVNLGVLVAMVAQVR